MAIIHERAKSIFGCVATTHERHYYPTFAAGGSLIAYKLLLNLYLSQRSGEFPTVKALFATIPFSDMGIRYHLRKLLDAGWMELKPSETDKRTKVCVPTEKFNKAWVVVLTILSNNSMIFGTRKTHCCVISVAKDQRTR